MNRRGKVNAGIIVGIIIILGLAAVVVVKIVLPNLPNLISLINNVSNKLTSLVNNVGGNLTTLNKSLSNAPLPPNIIAPSNIKAEATGLLTMISSLGTANATDPSNITPKITNNAPPAGFPVGTTDVTWTAINAKGLNATAVQLVTIEDPVFSSVNNQTIDATSSSGAMATFAPIATDYSNSGTDSVSCYPLSGSTFSIETTQVTCTASDSQGNTASVTFNVVVQDVTPPIISSTSSITQEATSSSGATVIYTLPTSTDYIDGATDSVTCSPASGTTFPLGTTTVSCSSNDSLGLTGTSTFSVTVQDTTPPTISSVSNITQSNTTVSGAVVTFTTPTATDIVDGTDNVTCNPASGSSFSIGVTPVSCSATDNAGNTASATFYVNITSP